MRYTFSSLLLSMIFFCSNALPYNITAETANNTCLAPKTQVKKLADTLPYLPSLKGSRRSFITGVSAWIVLITGTVQGVSIQNAHADHRKNVSKLVQGVNVLMKTPTGLPPSHKGADDTSEAQVSYIYDLALSILLFAYNNEPTAAHKIISYLKYYYDVPLNTIWKSADQTTGINGIIRILQDHNQKPVKAFVNGLDSRKRNTPLRDYYVDAGPHAWLGIALLHTDTKRYLPFAQQLGNFLLSLQDKDGAICAGPQQRSVAVDKPQNDRLQKKHTEHNISAFMFLKLLAHATRTQKNGNTALAHKYTQAQQKILSWLITKAYYKDISGSSYFSQGVWFGKRNVLPQKPYATDANTWPVAFALDEITPARAVKAIKSVERHALVRVSYKKQGTTPVNVIGVDFSDPDQTCIRKERNNTYHPTISPEWTAGLILAYYRLAIHFWEKGTKKRAINYKAKAEALLDSIWKTATVKNGTIQIPYATAQGLATGHGWRTPTGTEQSLAGIFVGFAAQQLFPSEPDSGKHFRTVLSQIPSVSLYKQHNALLASIPLKRRKPFQEQTLHQSQRDPSKIKNQAYEYTIKAWHALNTGRNKSAIMWASKIIQETTWRKIAFQQQKKKQNLGGIIMWPWGNFRSTNPRHWKIITSHFWALNNFAAAHWICATAYMNLKNKQKAIEHLKELLTYYSLAQIWDIRGNGFWNPINSLLDNNAGTLHTIWQQVYKQLKQKGIIIKKPKQITLKTTTGSIRKEKATRRGLFATLLSLTAVESIDTSL